MPVGVADTEGLRHLDHRRQARRARVKDVGTRGEPSVDAIVALQPDLVVMEADATAASVAQLEKFVPVLVTKGSDAEPQPRPDARRLHADRHRGRQDRRGDEAARRLRRGPRRRQAEDRRRRRRRQAASRWPTAGRRAARSPSGCSARARWSPSSAIQLGLKNVVDRQGRRGVGPGPDRRRGPDRRSRTPTCASSTTPPTATTSSRQGLAGNAIWDSLSFVQKKQLHKLPTASGPSAARRPASSTSTRSSKAYAA